jgi:N-dimethylarginine dimethylaminohydrolase
MSCVDAARDWRRTTERVAACPATLMCPPEHYAVLDVKNTFMEGQVDTVDRALAVQQWERLVRTLADEGGPVHVLDAAPGREDMVFTANPALVVPRPDGGIDVVLSNMRHASRRAEVPHLGAWFRARGVEPLTLPADAGVLEGHGDVLVVPGRHLLLGGYGGRTERSALSALADRLATPLVPLPLHGDVYYHLDTCLALLDEQSILLHPPAFLPEALERLAVLFPRHVEADPAEARAQLACNARALPGGAVVLPAQAERTAERLARAGYRPVPVDVSEFHRSGGSVYCLGLPVPASLAPAR